VIEGSGGVNPSDPDISYWRLSNAAVINIAHGRHVWLDLLIADCAHACRNGPLPK
jgi:hypothetical protein